MKEQEKMLAAVLEGLIQQRAPENGKLKTETALRGLKRALGVDRIAFERFGYRSNDHPFMVFVENAKRISVTVRGKKAWVQLMK